MLYLTEKLGAEGFIITDWEIMDTGISAGKLFWFVYGAAKLECERKYIGIDIGSYLDKFIFLDKAS